MVNFRIIVLILGIVSLNACSISSDKNDRKVYYIHNKGATLPVVVSGADTEEIILFVHGGPGSSGLLYYYAEAWENIRKKYRMVFYDQRGSGGGRGHITEKSITVDQHVDDLNVVVDSVRSLFPQSKIYLFGHSYGGIISAAYTSVNQNKLKGLMLLSPALNVVDLTQSIPSNMINNFIDPYLVRPDISQKLRTEWEKIKKFYQDNTPLVLNSFIQHNSYVIKADPIQGLSKFNEYYQATLPKLLADPLLEPIIWTTQMGLMLGILDNNNESARNLETDPKYTLSNINVPAMLIVGTKDLVVPKESSIRSFNKIGTMSSKKSVLEYDNAAHNAFLEHPQRIETDIVNFIRLNP